MSYVELPGVKASKVPATSIDSVTECLREVRKGNYCGTAGDNGAIVAYRDDKGKLRGQFYRYQATKSDETFSSYAALRRWLKTWWPEMGAR